MKIKIVQIKTVIYEPDLAHYQEKDRSVEGVIRQESENADENGCEYMDMFEGTQTLLTFEPAD